MRIGYQEILRCVRFDDYEDIKNYIKIIKNGIEFEWKKHSQEVSGDESALDEKAAQLQLFEYRMKAMQLCCLIEVWEQDLFNFLYEIATKENNTELLRKLTNSKNSNAYLDNDYGKHLTEAYKFLYDKQISEVSDIDDIRNIVNAIKHGTGKSLVKLKEKLGDAILADSNLGFVTADGNVEHYKQADYDVNTLTSIVLNLDGKVEEAHIQIVKFWNKTYEFEDVRKHIMAFN